MRSALLKSADKLADGSDSVIVVVIIITLFLGCMAITTTVANEKLEDQIEALRLERDSLAVERDALLEQLEAVEGESQRARDQLQKDISEIKEMLTGAREAEMILSAYSPLDPRAAEGVCYSGDPSITASGERVEPGVTIAAGRDIPFGTRVWIEGYGVRVVQDRGGRVGSNNLDLAVWSKAEAYQIGRQLVRVLIF